MCISEPTTAISSTKLIDSGAISKLAPTLNDPAASQSYRWTVRVRPLAGWPSICTNAATPTTKDASDIATPSRCPHLSVRRPPSSRIAAPASGNAISSQEADCTPWAACACSCGSAMRFVIKMSSVLQQVRVVDRRGLAASEDRHDDRQADDDLGGGHDHHEERDDLSVESAVHTGKGDKGQVRGVQHELDAHEDHDGIAADEHPDRPDREQDGRQRQVVAGHFFSSSRDSSSTCPSVPPSSTAFNVALSCRTAASGPSPWRSSWDPPRRRAMTGLTDSSE